jgi:hypothetical protein
VVTKKTFMSDEAFAELMWSAEQALAYERGAREGYRVTQMESPKSPRKNPADEAVSEIKLGTRRKQK